MVGFRKREKQNITEMWRRGDQKGKEKKTIMKIPVVKDCNSKEGIGAKRKNRRTNYWGRGPQSKREINHFSIKIPCVPK